jgi:autotransporter strand-loop-strand O-heptosyltransferase
MEINKPTLERSMIGDPEGINRVRRNYAKEELVHYHLRDAGSKTLRDKEVLVHLDSFCVGDTICFASFLETFVNYHGVKKIYVTTFFPEFFESDDERIQFVPANSNSFIEADCHVNVGYDKDNLHHTLGGLFYATRDSMRIPHSLNPGRSFMKKKDVRRQPRKIVIAPESLKKIARWDFPNGWQTVVDHFIQRGYQIYNVSFEDYIKLDGVINYNGFTDINVSLGHILEAAVFVGLSSGLAWMSWAYSIPTVMISGFTKNHNEFPCYRVSNSIGCNGCFNIVPQVLNSCPIFYGTKRQNECHRSFITPAMVIEKIEQALIENQVSLSDDRGNNGIFY